MGRDDPDPNTTNAPTASLPDSRAATDLPIALPDLLQLCANDRTRQLLYLLTARGGTVFLEELEAHFDGDDVRVELRHSQIPRLVDFHIIDYNRDAGALTLTPIGDDLRPALETIKSLEDPAVVASLDRPER